MAASSGKIGRREPETLNTDKEFIPLKAEWRMVQYLQGNMGHGMAVFGEMGYTTVCCTDPFENKKRKGVISVSQCLESRKNEAPGASLTVLRQNRKNAEKGTSECGTCPPQDRWDSSPPSRAWAEAKAREGFTLLVCVTAELGLSFQLDQNSHHHSFILRTSNSD